MLTPGQKFRHAMAQERPLQLIGVINPYIALMAKEEGYRALYLSGAGVANASYALPDIGVTSLDNVLEEAQRITAVMDLPLLVDIDTGWGNSLMIARAIRAMEHAGVAAIHIEDQAFDRKRCGHLDKKSVVSTQEMTDRIKAAADARYDPSFIIMARTDAFATEGLEATIERALEYKEAGADMLFPEALQTQEQFRLFKQAVTIPCLANMTEFGKTPLLTVQELAAADIDIILYPLSVMRTMHFAAKKVLKGIRQEGSQKNFVEQMQTREELYQLLNYDPRI